MKSKIHKEVAQDTQHPASVYPVETKVITAFNPLPIPVGRLLKNTH
jgi:hypothetical protein